MNRPPENPVVPDAGRHSALLTGVLRRIGPRRALVVSLTLLALTACSTQHSAAGSGAPDSRAASSDPTGPKRAETNPSAADAARPDQTDVRRPEPAACLSSQLALSLDAGDGRFDGMSHSGTMLALRNTGTVACTLPARPRSTLTDASKQPLDIVAQEVPDDPAVANATITLAPGATATSDMRWVSGDVYDGGHCETPTRIVLGTGTQAMATAFAGRLCGAGGTPSSYTLTAFRPAQASAASATAHATTYVCDDGRSVKAVYPDSETAILVVDGKTSRLRIAVSADGARYVGDHWQWWTKGMHQARLAPMKDGESLASTRGVDCHAP